MDKKKIIIISGLGIILILLIVVIIANVSHKKTNKLVETNPEQTPAVSVPAVSEPEVATVDPFRAEVPEDIAVPEIGTPLTAAQKEEIALPTVVVPAAPGVTSKYRSFDIKAEDGKFVPLQVIVNVGDTVHVNFTAVDKAYDIVFPSYNMKQTAQAGQTKILEFQAIAEGKFTYYCQLCGGPDKGPKGNIIVVKP